MDALSVIFMSLVAFCYVDPGLGYDISTLSRCSDPSLDNPGYSSIVSHGSIIWTHCGFPNPKREPIRCGRPYSRDVIFDLCDPDQVFPSEDQTELDLSLWRVEASTPHQCTPWHGVALNYSVILTAVRYLRIPDLSSNETCINNCGEIVPDVDEFVRSATDEEKQLAIDNFARGLIDNYKAYFCDNFLVIAYWENETMISTALSEGMASVIAASQIAAITRRAEDLLSSGRRREALLLVIKEYRSLLMGFTPAMVLLAVHVTTLALCVIAVAAYALYGNKSDYYDEGSGILAVKTTVKVLVGVWLLEQILMALLRLQDRVKLWVVIFPFLGLAAAVIGAFFLYQQQQQA